MIPSIDIGKFALFNHSESSAESFFSSEKCMAVLRFLQPLFLIVVRGDDTIQEAGETMRRMDTRHSKKEVPPKITSQVFV